MIYLHHIHQCINYIYIYFFIRKETIKKLSKSDYRLLEKLWDHSNCDAFKGINQSNNEIYYIERTLRFTNLLNNVLKTIYYLSHVYIFIYYFFQ